MTDTASKWDINGEHDAAAPTYGAPPPTYGDANAPQAYNNPPGYAQPPSVGYTAQPQNQGYTGPPAATNPNYASPPVQNYNNPPQQGYAPPTQNYANPPGPSYANPPVQNYNQPPAQNYASPPQTGPSYASPPPGGPSHTVIQTHTTVTQTRVGFTYALCDCFGNMQWCCYVCWCTSCAIADLRTQSDGAATTWWLTMLVMTFLSIFWWVPATTYTFLFLYNLLGCGFLMCIAQNMRQRLNISGGDGCKDCLLGYCCMSCRICQLGRELEMVQIPEVRELVLNIQKGSPIGQGCMTQGRIM